MTGTFDAPSLGNRGPRCLRWLGFRRWLVAWSPVLLWPVLVASLKPVLGTYGAELAYWLLVCGLALLSAALPERGLPDRIAGTWPVLR